MVKRSKKCYSIWERGHGWTLLLPRSCTWLEVTKVLHAMFGEGL